MKRRMKRMTLLLAVLMLTLSPASAYAETQSTETVTSETVVDTVSENDAVEATTEETTVEEESSEEIPQTTEETETTTEDTLSENTVSENTVSENSVSENTLGHVKVPGLQMQLSAQMIQEKKELCGTADRLVKLRPDIDYVKNEAVFVSNSSSTAKQIAKGYGADLISFEDGVGVIRFEENAIDIIEMAEDPEVKLPAVYPNYQYYTCDDIPADESDIMINPKENNSTDAVTVENDTQTVTVNDPYMSIQTYHDVIHTPEAWTIAQGSGVKVGVIDSGIKTNHEDLKANISSASSTFEGAFKTSAYNGAVDNNNHGTNVSGIIAEIGNNKKGGIGVAYKAKIVSIKALENNPITGRASGSTVGIIRAINKAVASGVRVINMSIGGYYYDALYEAAIDKAVNKGIVVVVAAGNEGRELSKTIGSTSYCSPACFDNVITVAALDVTGKRRAYDQNTYFSNYGDGIIDIAAPGVNNFASYAESNSFFGYYNFMTGTSQASPVVAGVVALILSANPQLLATKDKTTVDTVKSILCSSANNLNNTTYYGAGCVDAAMAVGYAKPDVTAPVISNNDVQLTNNEVVLSDSNITMSATATVNGETSTPVIYYTLDGKTPTVNSTQYTNPFKIPASGKKTIKAVAVINGRSSAVTTVKVKMNALVQSIRIFSKIDDYVVGAGKSLQLITSVYPDYATNKSVKWEIPQAYRQFASITQSGKLTAAKLPEGAERVKIYVQASSKDGTKSIIQQSFYVYPAITELSTNSPKKILTVPATYNMKSDIIATPTNGYESYCYTTSNAKVATVDASGVVTAIGAGTAKIKATARDGSGKNVTCTVTVASPVTSVTVTSKSGIDAVGAGKSLQMIATVNEGVRNNKVTWSLAGTTDSNFATINASSGVVKTKKVITSKQITVKAVSKENSNKYGTKTITIYPITSTISLNATSKTLATTDRGSLTTSYQLIATGNSGSLGQFSYTSSNKKVATVAANGTITAVRPGSTTITAKALDGSGKTAKCSVKVVNPVNYIVVSAKAGTVDNSSAVVGRGRSIQLSTAVNSNATNKKVSWSILEGGSYAALNSSGKITGKANGTVTVKATATDGTNTASTFTVYVEDPITSLVLPTDRGYRSSAVATMYKDSRLIFSGDEDGNGDFDGVFDYLTMKNSGGAHKWQLIDIKNSNGNAVQFCENSSGNYYLYATNKGTSKITFTVNDGKKYTATLTIKVK